jgi:hypothetical protein
VNSAANAGFAGPVANRRVDEIDAGVEHGIQHLVGLVVRDFVGRWRAAQIHGAESQRSHGQTGTAE